MLNDTPSTRSTSAKASPPASRRWSAGLVALAMALAATLTLAACGGSDEPSTGDAADAIVASFTEAGVTAPESEQACLRDKLGGRLTGDDAKATKLTDLSQGTRVAVAGDVEACFSTETLATAVPKVISKEAGLTNKAATCVETQFDGKVSYTSLVRQERAAVDAIAKLVRKCATVR